MTGAGHTLPEPAPNTVTRPYRGLSVQEVDVPLTDKAITTLLLGREIYRRTDFLALRRGSQTALVAVHAEDRDPLFAPVTDLRVLAGPADTVWIDDPDTDVGIATALARTALQRGPAGASAYVVQGRYEHVNFIWRPAPIRIHVTEVVPPDPPKLYAMAEQVVAFDEDLPPVELVLDAVDIRALAGANPAPHYLLPCRGSGVDLPGEVSFLDTRPEMRSDWLLIGCDRSRQFHEHFYGTEPERVELCPRARTKHPDGAAVLAKCCLLERGIAVSDGSAVVPWGSNLDEVRVALRALCGLAPSAAVELVPSPAEGPIPALASAPALTSAPAAAPIPAVLRRS
ncbi:MAG: hypothetical protein M3519_08285 [Actinomycetota bacterium]|nr:hypothetical protein [Actinomycetota bacterium]MDQ3465735.1 hypothetical protein [Actinomycetota bacterium]